MSAFLRRLAGLFRNDAPIDIVPEPGTDMVWFQHFHKAGGTSVIDAARAAGHRFFEPNINGNPMIDPHTPVPIWDWDQTKLADWLIGQQAAGVTFVCAEFGFSHVVFDIDMPRLKRVGTLRRPKDRLVSNFIYDVAEGFTDATTIFDYMNPDHTHTMPDYYTRLVTGESGPSARNAAVEAIKKFDYVSVLEVPETHGRLLAHLPGLTPRHTNRTDYDHEAVRQARVSVEKAHAELDALCADEMQLYRAVEAAFA